MYPSKYIDCELNPDLESGKKCINMLSADGFECPPTAIISLNARFDPHFHMRVGAALRPLREQGYLLIGTGGAVHNLYRNVWHPMLKYSDNFAQETPPGEWAIEFRQAVEDAISENSGPSLRCAITRLMKHPRYRDAHATDDHFMAAAFVAGAAGSEDDIGVYGRLGAETWELTNMCNSQFTIGHWA
ncbi:hypothetical protein ACMFMG_011424 [Clarireedia jacksonii]